MTDENINNLNSMDSIAKRVEIRRKELGYSLQDVADLAGISKSTLQRYERGGIKNIPLSKLKPLANALQTTPDYLMGWVNSPEDIPLNDDENLESDNVDIKLIARAGKKLSPEQIKKLKEMAILMFPEAFKE